MTETTTTEKVDYTSLVEQSTSGNPLANIIGQQLVSLANRLGEIAEQVNDKPSDGPPKPTIGVVLGEAKKAEDNTVVQGLLANYEAARTASKNAYRELLVSLHPEFANLAEDDDTDDSEKTVLVTEAKDVYSKIRAGLTFLGSQSGIPEDFANNFLGAIPVVEGARQRTSLGGDGTTIRPRFSVITIEGPNDFTATTKTFTDTVKSLAGTNDPEAKKIGTSDLSDAWVKAGGTAETPSNTKIDFEIGEYAFSTVKA